MRPTTFVLSLFVHALMIAAAVVVPIVATDTLPHPRDGTTFVVVTPEIPTVPPPPARRAEAPPPSSRNAAPVEAPPDIQPEPIARVVDDVPPPAGAGFIVGGGDVPGGVAPPGPPVSRQPIAAAPQSPVRVGGDVRPPQKVHHVAPEYPAIARSARVSGIVILEALIAEDGTVRDVRVLRSTPLLDEAAAAAVRQWRFTPTLLNGVPVPVLMTVTVSFALH